MADGSSGSAMVVSGDRGGDARLVDVSIDEMIVKAGGSSSAVTATNRLPMPDEEAQRLTRAGALVPFYSPEWLALLVETSTVLGPAIRALQSNVDGHGFTLKPRLDLADPKIRETIADSITLERLLSGGGGLKNPRRTTGDLTPTPVDVDLRLHELQTRLRIEHARAMAFFSACCPGIGKGLTWLRKELRRDRQGQGSGYLGIRRDGFGEPAEFEWLPGVQMRLRPVVKDKRTGLPTTVTVEVPRRTTPITIDFVETEIAYRTFVQFGLTREVYFKEYGDPRIFSSRTGDMYESVEDLPSGHCPATEVVHLKIPSAITEYGVPEWIGATPCVTGLRAAEEVNAMHFDSNGIPRMMILVSGGSLKQGAEEVIKDAIRAHTKGRKNYGGILILSATPPEGASAGARVSIEVKSLKESIPGDGLFQTYSANMRDVVLSQMRIPRFVLGILDDVNKSTSEEGREFVENEVYQPMRTEFDEVMTSFLESMGIYWWTFSSNSPINRDPVTMIDMVKKAAEAGGATINNVRDVMGDAFNTRFAPIPKEEKWGDMPLALASLFIQAQAQQMGLAPPPGSPQSAATIAGLPPAAEPDTAAKSAPVSKVRPVVKSQADLVRALEGMVSAFDASASAAQAFDVATAEGDLLVIPMDTASLVE